jgi:hypothetical protein
MISVANSAAYLPGSELVSEAEKESVRPGPVVGEEKRSQAEPSSLAHNKASVWRGWCRYGLLLDSCGGEPRFLRPSETKGGVGAPPYKLSLSRRGLAVVFNVRLGCFASMVRCVFMMPTG